MTAALLPAPDDDCAPPLPTAAGAYGVGLRRIGPSEFAATDLDEARPSRRPYLVPVPDCEPPFDDEIGRCPHHGRTDCGTEPTVPRFEVRHGSWHAPGRSSVQDRPVARTTPTVPVPVPVPEQWVPQPGLPKPFAPAPPVPRRAATRPSVGSADHSARLLARALVEVLAGHRPLPQLRTFCTPQIFAALDRRGRHPTPALPHMLSVRVCEPADGVAEVAAVYRRGNRVRMVAFRLERSADPTAPAGGRWTITEVQPG